MEGSERTFGGQRLGELQVTAWSRSFELKWSVLWGNLQFIFSL